MGRRGESFPHALPTSRQAASRVRIVTDSASDILPRHAQALGITVVPNRVVLDGQAYRDGIDLTPAEFFTRLPRLKSLPRTEPASQRELYDAYLAAFRSGASAVVSIHISSHLSEVVAHAREVSDYLASAPISLIDSLQAGIGMWPAVIESAKVANVGAPVEDVVGMARSLLARARMFFLVETLEYLRRGGRIGRAQEVLGTVLDARPILTIEGGEVSSLETVRPRERALLRLRELVLGQGPLRQIILCGSSIESMARIESMLQEKFDGSIQKTWLGPTLGANAGPVVAIAAVYEEGAVRSAPQH